MISVWNPFVGIALFFSVVGSWGLSGCTTKCAYFPSTDCVVLNGDFAWLQHLVLFFKIGGRVNTNADITNLLTETIIHSIYGDYPQIVPNWSIVIQLLNSVAQTHWMVEGELTLEEGSVPPPVRRHSGCASTEGGAEGCHVSQRAVCTREGYWRQRRKPFRR